MRHASSCAAARRSLPNMPAPSGATARSMTLGIICRCWPASPARCGTARPSRTGICRRRWRQIPVLERSEEHTSELQSLMRISYAVFCLKKKKHKEYKKEQIKKNAKNQQSHTATTKHNRIRIECTNKN